MKSMRFFAGLALWGCLWESNAFSAEPSTPSARAVRHSDVVFMYDNPKLYATYGCTVLGWAGTANAGHIERAHAEGVRLFSTSVGFLTEAARVIDFSPDFLDGACRNFEGKPFVVPWLWDHKHKGQPSWWWCTNSPVYRRYLDSRLTKMMKAKPDGLHIDDYRGSSGAVTWLSSCFCRYCMAGFREYLKSNVPKEKLASLGINDLEQFDYREFLLGRGVTPEEYKKQRARLPLAAEFLDFQVKTNTAFVADYRRKAEKLRGDSLALSVNSDMNDPQALAIASTVTHFCCEVSHAASNRTVAMHPIYIYKLADGLDRPVTPTASGGDWAYIAEHKRSDLVRLWIAMSYAHGQNFMVPQYQWCYTEKKGTHWYTGASEHYAWLFQFIRKNSRLFDGYEAVAPVAVVYDNAARRQGKGDLEQICITLAERNIPFTVVVAGDDWLDYRLDAHSFDRFKAVVVTKDLAMDSSQRALVEKTRTEGRVAVWPDEARLDKLLPKPIQVEGTDQAMVVVRASTKDAKAPPAIHLVNLGYDNAKDAIAPLASFTVRLRQDLLGGRKFTHATLYRPRAEPVRLEVVADREHTVISIPGLELWSIVELSDTGG